MPQTQSVSLFDKYGGLRALRSVILDFYDRVLDNDCVGPFFDDVDMPKLVDHQTKFFASVLGGPARFSDARLAAAHAHLRISHTQFDEVLVLLRQTLVEAGFSPQDLRTVLVAVEARRRLIT
jgi:hemoglobin